MTNLLLAATLTITLQTNELRHDFVPGCKSCDPFKSTFDGSQAFWCPVNHNDNVDRWKKGFQPLRFDNYRSLHDIVVTKIETYKLPSITNQFSIVTVITNSSWVSREVTAVEKVKYP